MYSQSTYTNNFRVQSEIKKEAQYHNTRTIDIPSLNVKNKIK